MTGGERNSKATDARKQAALQALSAGCTREAAAGAADVNRVTLWRWVEADATFRNEVEKAEARAEASFTAVIRSAAARNWQAAAWWLERRRYQSYARHDAVDVRIDIKAEVARLADELGLDAEAALAEVEAILAK